MACICSKEWTSWFCLTYFCENLSNIFVGRYWDTWLIMIDERVGGIKSFGPQLL
jgi:hypothetical protein